MQTCGPRFPGGVGLRGGGSKHRNTSSFRSPYSMHSIQNFETWKFSQNFRVVPQHNLESEGAIQNFSAKKWWYVVKH